MTQEDFEREVKRVRSILVRQAYRYVQQTDDAEDIVQDALLKLCLLRPQLMMPIDTFASVLVRNLSLNHLRQKHQTESLSDIDTVVDELTDSTEDIQTEHLMHIVESLPPREQTIIRLHDMEGMNFREISLLTGIPVTALRKSASRIRLRIRLRYLASISAVVLLFIAGIIGYKNYQWQQFARQYEGSYIVVGGQRNDNLKQIRKEIEQTLTTAERMEAGMNNSKMVQEAETDVLQSISDPEERRHLEELLRD